MSSSSVTTGFDPQAILARPMFQRITDVRMDDIETSFRNAQNRKKREKLATDGRLCILACDYPARRVVAAGDQPLAMANRYDYLTRIIAVLQAGAVDGLIATMDVLEELLILHELLGNIGKPGLLDNTLLIPSLNCGGLAGADWGVDDFVTTGPGVETCKLWAMDGVKLRLRLCDHDAASLKTLQACAEQITYANEVELPVFLEPLPVSKDGSDYRIQSSAEALAKITGVACALGDSSRNLWLTLPCCDNIQLAAAATTLPVLLLDDDAAADNGVFAENLKKTLQSSWNVRGVVVGRSVLYPASGGDPASAARTLYDIVHQPRE